ncbi:transposase [Salinibacter ruber]|nr:transposase [Salinibacter ruber]
MDEPLTPTSATVLSMDEIYFKEHGHLAVLVDLESREVVEMIQGMSTEAVLPFLRKHRRRLEEQGTRLEAAVMDMASHFRKDVRQVFPEARIVVDRFHVERKVSAPSTTCAARRPPVPMSPAETHPATASAPSGSGARTNSTTTVTR